MAEISESPIPSVIKDAVDAVSDTNFLTDAERTKLAALNNPPAFADLGGDPGDNEALAAALAAAGGTPSFAAITGDPDDNPALAAALDAAAGGAVPFSAITGDPTDNAALNAALEEKLDVAHNHDGVYEPADTALTALAALNDTPVGAGADQVAPGNHSHAPAIPGVEDGFLSAADKAKLDGIEAGATADQTGEEMVAAINANLGGTTWQGGGGGAHAASHASGGGDAVTLAQSQVTNLTTALAGKAATSHTHAQSDVTNLTTALAGKAATSHTHAQSDVTNLTTDLAGKAATSHTHALAVMSRYCVYMASDGSSMAAQGTQTVAFDTALEAVSGYSLSGGEVTLAAAGRYRFTLNLDGSCATSNTKASCPGSVQTDNSGSWATIPGAGFYLSEAGSSSTVAYQNVRAHVSWEVTTTASDKKIRVYIGPSIAGSSALVMKAGRCHLVIERIA